MATASIEEITAAVAGQTVPRRFVATVAAHPDVAALRKTVGGDPNEWQEWTYAQYRDLAEQAAAGLRARGVEPGERVLLFMRNRPDFHWLDMGAQLVRATPVSIYNSSSPEEVQYLAEHAEARVAIVEDAGFLERILKVRAELPRLEHVFVIEPPEGPLPTGVAPVEDLYSEGRLDADELAAATDPSDLATLIYTSGTTGPPKGVMLDQANIVYTAEQLLRCFELPADELVGFRLVSYLPMAHIAERMTSHYAAIINGYTVSCCPDPSQVAVYAREVRPQIMFGVPRVWEKVYAGVQAVLAADPERRQKFDEGVAAALEIKAAERDGKATQEQLDTWAFLDAVAFNQVRTLLGLDALRLAITGAAPIPREILEWFNALGIPLSEIYGMSESSGPATWDPYEIRPGTVGREIPGMEVSLDEDGELLLRGGNVFRGYLKAPDKTADTLIDGWLHTGDIAEIDGDGYVKIVDRKKELIITSGGKNISPANLEAALKTIPGVGQAAAIGDQRKFIAALVVLDPETAPAVARDRLDLQGLSLPELAAHPDVVALVQQGVDEVNQRFANVEQIKKFSLIGEEWLPDSDVLTPTSKLKRRGIHARYADLIEAMY